MQAPSVNPPVSLKYMRRFAVALIFIALAYSGSAKPGATPSINIPNFGKINDSYYRGAQPDSMGIAQLHSLGIRSVIDLQENGFPEESAWAKTLGIRYFNIPLSSKKPATPAQTQYFLKLVNDPDNYPVYVHCLGGRHRTGEMTAIYRMAHDSWTADQAYAEMKAYKYYSFGGHGSLKNYIYRFYGLSKISPVNAVN
jgi:protein tyrosine phosphatase (PTP) superfamily phosphohydrolase (DUF442 family)